MMLVNIENRLCREQVSRQSPHAQPIVVSPALGPLGWFNSRTKRAKSNCTNATAWPSDRRNQERARLGNTRVHPADKLDENESGTSGIIQVSAGLKSERVVKAPAIRKIGSGPM